MTFILPGGLGQLFAKTAVSAWDPTHVFVPTGTPYVFSNNNKTITYSSATTSGYAGTRGTKSQNSGLHYFEVTAVAISDPSAPYGASAGLGNATWVTSSSSPYVGGDTNSWGAQESISGGYYLLATGGAGTGPIGPAPANGQVIGCHYNATSGLVWMSVNGTFSSSGPAGGAGSADFTIGAGTLVFPACVVGYSAAAFTLNTAGPFTYTPYTGYSAWG